MEPSENAVRGEATASRDVEIIEYELAPKHAVKKIKKTELDISLDELFLDNLSMSDDVKNEEMFRIEQRRKRHTAVSSEDTDGTEETVRLGASSYSGPYIQTIVDQLIQVCHQIELQRNVEVRTSDVAHRCWSIRECPDHTCVSYQAVNPRCWYVAGENCGCRTHLGIPSCFDCMVFQMATSDPVIRIRETVFYILGMVKTRNERLRSLEREISDLKKRLDQLRYLKKQEPSSELDSGRFEEQLVEELVAFSRQTQKLDSAKDQAIFDQQKILTEQLGSAYLQLQALTAELEKTNRDLEQKVTDRTEELRKSNVALREAIKKTQEADRLKSEFIANISHELRTPLNSIIGFSKVLLSGIDGDVNETQRVDLTAIYNSGRHLLEIINSILDLSKIEAGKMELNLSTFDIVPLIDEIVTASQTLVMGKRVRVDSKIIGQLPLLEADATKIRQIIFNLVSNAAKFTDEGWITVQATADPELLHVSVVDTGMGIDKDEINVIFERFRQLDGSSTRRAGGTGLGLSIAKRFAEMHGGDITVESKIGKGSMFTLILPIGQKGRVPVQTSNN